MPDTIPIEKFIALTTDYLKYFNPDTPIYKIGDVVKTKGDIPNSYITRVIGSDKEGTVITNCSIPLVDFGKRIGQFYICQHKLKPFGVQGSRPKT